VAIGLFTAALIEAFRHAIKELRTTESKLRDATRHLLLADINHRIKNHLASLSAVLALSRRDIEDPRAREALDAAVQRLAVMGRVYTRLHASNQQVYLDAKEFLEGCARICPIQFWRFSR
jgi:two-component sensor histidine kinase